MYNLCQGVSDLVCIKLHLSRFDCKLVFLYKDKLEICLIFNCPNPAFLLICIEYIQHKSYILPQQIFNFNILKISKFCCQFNHGFGRILEKKLIQLDKPIEWNLLDISPPPLWLTFFEVKVENLKIVPPNHDLICPQSFKER